jgi:PIN domain nuclease of toxin-antitoxin system
VNLLLDTHLLLWAAGSSEASDGLGAAGKRAAALIDDPANVLHFSAASIWEVAIKSGLGRPDFQVDPHRLRRGLIDNGYVELEVTGQHAAGVASLPPIHKDPFDRMLVSQAIAEGITLVTLDAKLEAYPGPIQRV